MFLIFQILIKRMQITNIKQFRHRFDLPAGGTLVERHPFQLSREPNTWCAADQPGVGQRWHRCLKP